MKHHTITATMLLLISGSVWAQHNSIPIPPTIAASTFTYTVDPSQHTLVMDHSDPHQVLVLLPPDTYDVIATFNGAHAGGDLDGVYFMLQTGNTDTWPSGRNIHEAFHESVTTISFPDAPDTLTGSLFFRDLLNLGDNPGSATVTFISTTSQDTFVHTVYPNQHTVEWDETGTNQVVFKLAPGTYDVTATFAGTHAGGDLDGVFFMLQTGNIPSWPSGHAMHEAFHESVTRISFPDAPDSVRGILFFRDLATLGDNYGTATVTFTAVLEDSSGLVAYYPFNGNANDESGNGNDGTVNGASLTADRFGNSNSAYSFDGIDDYIDCGNDISLNINNALTLVSWVFSPTFNDGRIISKWGLYSGYDIDISNNYLRFSLNQLVRVQVPISDFTNSWIHISATWDGYLAKVYFNGILMDSTIHSDALIDSPYNLMIGRMANLAPSVFDGVIDEIHIYNRALTASEIQTLYNENVETTWSVQLKSSIGSYNDNDNYLGVASGATNGFDTNYDEVEPPSSPGGSISLYFPHPEWNSILGDNFSKDIRPEITLTDTMQVWDFRVKSTDAGSCTLTFVYTNVPSVPVILENVGTGERQNLSNNSTYTFTTVADSAHPFKINIGDTTSPSLTLGSSCSGPSILISDSAQTLHWTTTDGFEVDSVKVYFSSDSGNTYSLVSQLGGTASYDWTIPDAEVIYGGKIKVKSQDYVGNYTEKVSDYVFAIVGDSISSTVNVGWNLWGVPINPTNDTMTINLNDDFTDYWVTYDYVNNGYTYDGILKETEGYWLGTLQNATIDIKGTPLNSNTTMDLSQGWDIISNPLVLDVTIDSLTFTKDGVVKTHSEALSSGWVNSIYKYDGSGYVSSTVFEPWSGYWIGVLEDSVSMTFPIHRYDGSSLNLQRIQQDEGWWISFEASTENAQDITTIIGVNENGNDVFDNQLDAVKPPLSPSPEYVSLNIPHPEWNHPLGNNFAKDIRSEIPNGESKDWTFIIETSESDVAVEWNMEHVPDEYEVGIDTDGDGYFEDMRIMEELTLSDGSQFTVRIGSNVLGIDDGNLIPEVFSLHQNYPNPFNPVTTIRYDLPEVANVRLTIYDLLGREVRTLVHKVEEPGFKSVVWNGKDKQGQLVGAGVYLYRIEAEGYVHTKKLVLLK